MKYDILKDKKPEDTVIKIKNTLKELGITTTETFTETSYSEKTSVKIEIKGTDICTNGKGTCKINALASGYGEFMERLQAGFIIPYPEIFHNEKWNKNDFENNYYIKKEFENISQEQKKYFESICLKNSETENVNLLEYKSIRTKETQYLPNDILKITQSTNGYSSGNTYEEAFVQALSEICERYEQKKIIKNQIKTPDVPFEYYSKYNNITRLIKYIENNGYKITIKDASCGELPVIMTILENNSSPIKKFCISFGSHPCLSIAIERTLTEFLQGFSLENKKNTRLIVYNKYFNPDAYIQNSYITKMDIEKGTGYFDFLFGDKPDYNFDNKLWDNNKASNKTLSKNLAEKVLNIAEDIFIRNYTFLGQPAISLYVPKMSKTFEKNEQSVINRKHFDKIIDAIQNNTLKEINAENIYYCCEYLQDYYNEINFLKKNFHTIHIASAILLNDEYKIKKALYFARKHSELAENFYNEKYINTIRYKALERYFSVKFDNMTQNKINQIITDEFGQDYLNKIHEFVKEFSLKKVIALIIKNYKNFFTEQKKQIEYKNEILSKYSEKLFERYKNNPPDQEQFINFIYED